MKKLLYLLLLLPSIAIAGSVTLDWTAPTLNDDGTPLTDLAGYKLYYGTATGDYPNVIDIADPSALSYVVDSLPPGDYFFVATAYNTALVESIYSNEATKTVPPVAPAPPGNLTVQDLVAFVVLKIDDGISLVAAGSVPSGTSCDPDFTISGYGPNSEIITGNVVPYDSVTWWGSVTSRTVVAKCS
jgi:hypothetical protein